MRPDRDIDWGERVKEQAKSTTEVRRLDLQVIRRTALHAGALTGDEHWDHFLSLVKHRIEERKAEIKTHADFLINSDIFTNEELINAKLAVRLFGREVEALEWVIELPAKLQEQGDQADKLLGTIDETPD
jgi:imidazolonepropionase-like amidohydrolase